MQPIDWHLVERDGMPELLRALKQLEAGLIETQTALTELSAAQPPAERMASWWFRRYAQLYGLLVEMEGPEIGAWLAGKIGGGGTAASACGARIGSDTGCPHGERGR